MRQLVYLVLLLAVAGCGKPEPPMAGSKWAEALRDPDAKQRKQAAFTLGNIGPSDPAVRPALVGALKDRDAGVRREAILALLKCGPGSQEAVAALEEVRQRDRDPQVRTCAARALAKLEGG